MSTKSKLGKIVAGVNKTASKAAEKARRDAIAATQANIDRIDAGLDPEKGAVDKVGVTVQAHAFAHGEAFLLTRADGTVLAQAQTLDAAKYRARFFGIKQSAIAEGAPAGFDAKAPVPPSPETAKLRKLTAALPEARADGAPAKARARKEPGEKKVSALDAAAQVLARCTQPKSAKQLVESMAAQGLWKSPGGKTPDATLYSAMLREINTKGKEARFKKVDKGLFAAA